MKSLAELRQHVPGLTKAAVAAAVVVALAGGLYGCSTTTEGGAVGADRQQLLLVSSAQLEQMATQEYRQLLNVAAQKRVLNVDAGATQRVRSIANRLIPQTSVFRPDARNWQWEVNVISSDQINAFCMPGGKIMVFTGLINQLRASDSELAVVLGHEIAHALREHSREQISQSAVAQTAIGIGAALFGLEGAADIAGAAYNSLLATRFSRSHETEADRIGLELAARAGFDPRAGVSLWQKMLSASSGGPPQFLSSHPSGENRIREIEALLPTVMPLYAQAQRR
jgi:predicted Zn-dependent protease